MITQNLCFVLVVAFCGLHRYFASGDECREVSPVTCKKWIRRWSYRQLCTNQTTYWRSKRSECPRTCNLCYTDRHFRVDVSRIIEASTGRSVTLDCTYYSYGYGGGVYLYKKWTMETSAGETRLVYETRNPTKPGSRDRFGERYEGRAEIKTSHTHNPYYRKHKFDLKLNQLTKDDEGLYTFGAFTDSPELVQNSTWLEIVVRQKIVGCKLDVKGLDYNGDDDHAKTGQLCRVWGSPEVLRHMSTSRRLMTSYVRWKTAERLSNHCRNPDQYEGGPWCYIEAEDVPSWRVCDIKMCNKKHLACKVDVKGLHYNGNVHYVNTGQVCRIWGSPEVLSHMSTSRRLMTSFARWKTAEKLSNHCRNPDQYEGGPWCYIEGEDVPSWRVCDIKMCNKESSDCKVDVKGFDYNGDVHYTNTGHECRIWGSPEVQRHMATSKRLQAAFNKWSIAVQLSNFCRNPDHWEDGPWCYIEGEDVPSWRVCDIKICDGTDQTESVGEVAQGDQLRPNTLMLFYSLAGINFYWKL